MKMIISLRLKSFTQIDDDDENDGVTLNAYVNACNRHYGNMFGNIDDVIKHDYDEIGDDADADDDYTYSSACMLIKMLCKSINLQFR